MAAVISSARALMGRSGGNSSLKGKLLGGRTDTKFSLSFAQKGGIQNGSVCDIHQNRFAELTACAEAGDAVALIAS